MRPKFDYWIVPPKDLLELEIVENEVLKKYTIDAEYRKALYDEFPDYSIEEIIGSYLGYNPEFLSQRQWIINQNEELESNESYEFT